MFGWIAVTIAGLKVQRHQEKNFRNYFGNTKDLNLLEKKSQSVKR